MYITLIHLTDSHKPYYCIKVTEDPYLERNRLRVDTPFLANVTYSIKSEYATIFYKVLRVYLKKYHVQMDWYLIEDRTFLIEILNWLRDKTDITTGKKLYNELTSIRNPIEYKHHGKKIGYFE